MKPVTLKPFKVGYDEEKIAFYPRMMTEAEMEEVQQSLVKANDSDDKFQKRFEIFKDAIADWSDKAPQKVVKVKGEVQYVPLVENAETIKDAIERFFDKRTAETEKVIRAAFNSFCSLATPDIDFL